MKFYPGRVLKSHRNEDLVEQKEGGASVPITLGALAVEALLRELPSDNNAPGKTKIQRWKLAKDIQKNISGKPGHFILLSIEELNLIKTRVFQGFPATIVGPAEEALEMGDEEESVSLREVSPGN